jgi:hypothetical protein
VGFYERLPKYGETVVKENPAMLAKHARSREELDLLI